MTLRAGFGKLVGTALAGSLLLAAALLTAAPAVAKPCNPQGHGNSEIAQYLENVPGPCGEQGIGGGNGSGNSGGSGGGGSGSDLPAGAIQELNSFGTAGAATAQFAEATAPPGSGDNGKATGSGASGGSQAGGSATGGSDADGSALSALADLVGGGSDQGIGTLLPLLLGAIFLGGMGFVALRRGYTR
jgi:hypothetical protein